MSLRRTHFVQQKRLANCCSGDLAVRLEIPHRREARAPRPSKRSRGYLLEMCCSGDPDDRLVHRVLRDPGTSDFAPHSDRPSRSVLRRAVRGQ
jgi:hypothetical protein